MKPTIVPLNKYQNVRRTIFGGTKRQKKGVALPITKEIVAAFLLLQQRSRNLVPALWGLNV